MQTISTYSPAEANKETGIGLRTIYTAIHAGELPAIKLGEKRIRIRPDALAEWMKGLETRGQK
jgi:excisionase family DNA binding protein